MLSAGTPHAPALMLAMATILMALPSVHAFAVPPHHHRSPSRKQVSHVAAAASDDDLRDFKRVFAASALIVVTPFLGWNADEAAMIPPAAHALKEKNELLCNTGFFTNVGAWYCTDIGNIGDEGQARPLSGDAAASVDSLMGKFDLDGGGFGEDASGKAGNGQSSDGQSSTRESGDATKDAKRE